MMVNDCGSLASTYGSGLGSGIDKLLAKVIPVLIRGGFLDDDLSVVVGQLEDDVLVLLRKLEVVVVRSNALLRD